MDCSGSGFDSLISQYNFATIPYTEGTYIKKTDDLVADYGVATTDYTEATYRRLDQPLDLGDFIVDYDLATTTWVQDFFPSFVFVQTNYPNFTYTESTYRKKTDVLIPTYTDVIGNIGGMTDGTYYTVTHNLGIPMEQLDMLLVAEVIDGTNALGFSIGDKFSLRFTNYVGASGNEWFGLLPLVRPSIIDPLNQIQFLTAEQGVMRMGTIASGGTASYAQLDWSEVKLHVRLTKVAV